MNENENNQAEMSSNVKNQPKIMISYYQLNPQIAQAGKNFDLSFGLYNTNSKNAIYNLKATIEQNLGAQPQNSGENNAMVSDGSVFSPVNQ